MRRRVQGISGAVLLATEVRLSHELRLVLGREKAGVDEWELMAGLVATIELQRRRLKVRYSDAMRTVLLRAENDGVVLDAFDPYALGEG